MTDLNTALGKLKDLPGISVKTDANLLLRLLNTQLGVIREALEDETQKQETLPSDTFFILEEVLWTARKFVLNSCALSSLIAIFRELLVRASGFQIRNMVTATLNVCNTKTCLAGARECALDVLVLIVKLRMNDCASQAVDIMQATAKLYKSPESTVRLRMLRVLSELIKVGNGRLSDLYSDIFKLTQRMTADKNEEIRVEVYNIYTYIARYLPNFEVITSEALLLAMTKGFEDEAASVQNASARAYATLEDILMQTYIDKQEQVKIDAARGGSDSSSNSEKVKPKVQATTRLSLSRLTGMKKAVVEEILDFRTVIENIIRLVMKNMGHIRVSYMLVLTYLIQSFIDRIDVDDLEWLVSTLVSLPQDGSIQQLSYEEHIPFRARLSFLFRTSIIAQVNESQLITVGNALIKCGGGLEASSRSDLEMQFIMDEVDHTLNILGPAAVSLRDEALTCATINLRHACFGVRAAAAHVMLTLSCVIPGFACELIANAIANTKKQALQLMTLDIGDNDNISFEDDTIASSFSTAVSSNTSTTSMSSFSKKKSVKEMERLQRMYFFHGHALVIALIIQHIKYTPQGVSFSLISTTFDLALEMMNLDFQAMKMSVSGKQIACAIIRAGGLILSSCLSLGYPMAKMKLPAVLQICHKLFHMADNNGSNNNGGNCEGNSEDMLYEVMCIEAATACVYSLLLHAADALLYEENCLSFIIDHLEACFRLVKNKYQPVHRLHFRFRTLHVILLECFTLLPPGSYPNSCQQMYVEALRVFRDCITSGVECTSPLIQGLVNDSANNKSNEGTLVEKKRKSEGDLGESPGILFFIQRQLITNETIILQRLETFTSTLQKKESEAFLSFFGQSLPPLLATNKLDFYDIEAVNVHASSEFQSSLLDTRSMDAAIKLLAVTFSHQLSEYQDKSIQLFAQAVSQLTTSSKDSSSSSTATSSTRKLMFSSSSSSEEEKKRKEKKNQQVILAIVCTLNAIVQTFPVHSGQYFELDYQWRQNLVDQLFSFCTNKSCTIRYLASITLAEFAVKWRGSNIITSISQKIRGSVVSGLEKKGDVHVMDDFGGYVVALGFLWQHAGSLPDTQSLITTTIFDCLNKKDIASTFFSHAFQSLTTICYRYSHLSSSSGDTNRIAEEVKDFIEKVLYVIEASHANIVNIDVDHSFILDTIHLLGTVLHLTVKYSLPWEIKRNVVTALKLVFLQSNEVQNMQMWCWAMAQIQKIDFFNAPQSDLKLPIGEINIAINRILFSAEINENNTAITGNDGVGSLVRILCQEENNRKINLPNIFFFTNCLCVLIHQTQQQLAKTVLFDFHGLEIKEGGGCAVRSKRYYKRKTCQLEEMFKQVILEDMERHPSHRTVWVMYLRSVVLGLSGDSLADTTGGGDVNNAGLASGNSGDDNDNNGDEGGGGGEGMKIAPPSASGIAPSNTPATKNASTKSTGFGGTEDMINLSGINNLAMLTTSFRDNVIRLAPKLDNYRLTTRVFALDLLTRILNSTFQQVGTQVDDISLARRKTEEMFTQLKLDFPSSCPLSTFLDMTLPWELYLVDLINLSCFCVGFALHDKNQPWMTETATFCVLTLVEIFLHVKDPDFVGNNPNTVEDRVLTQFVSQLSGAVRSTTSHARNNPRQLRWTTKILFLLVEEGFVKDKIVVKRMLKPISTFFNEFFFIPEGTERSSPVEIKSSFLRPKNDKIHETVALEEMLLFTEILARLLLLTTKDQFRESEVKVAIESLQVEIGPQKINRLFVGVLVDTLRMQLSVPTADNDPLHPLRGGQTYSPFAVLDITNNYTLKSTFSDVALTLTLTLSSSTEISLQGDLLLFVVTFVTLELAKIDFPDGGEKEGKLEQLLSAAQALTAKCDLQEEDLLLLLNQLQRLLLSLQATQSSTHRLVRSSMRIIMNISPTLDPSSSRAVLTVLEDMTQLIFSTLFPQLLTQDTQMLIEVEDLVTTSPSTVQKSTFVGDENIVKEVVICFAMIAAKTDEMPTLLHIARLFAMLAFHRATTSKSTFLTPKSEVCMTLMKAYGRVFSLLEEEGREEEMEQVVHVLSSSFMQGGGQSEQELERVGLATEVTILLWMAAANATTTTTSAGTEVNNQIEGFPQEIYDLLTTALSSMSVVFQRLVISCMLRLLTYLPVDVQQQRVGHQVVLEVICRVTIAHRLPIEEDSQNRSLILRGTLLIFNLLQTAEQRVQFLHVLLPLLCGTIQRFADDSAYQLLTGKVLAHLARSSSDEFKAQVLLLNDDQRQNLQQAMRVAILSEQQQQQQQQQSQPAGASAASVGAGGLKLNIDRYRAANT